MRPAARILQFLLILAITVSPFPVAPSASAQEADEKAAPADVGSKVDQWDRLIYVPFKELRKVFDNQDASAVIPYAEYLELLQSYLDRNKSGTAAPDAVIAESRFEGVVEQDIVRLNAEFQVTVLKQTGWAIVPMNFGSAAVGKVTSENEANTILRGLSKGKYQLLLNGAGQHIVTVELMAAVKTSPENRSFAIDCPAVGISELSLIIPEPDQSIEIAPLQLLLPTDDGDNVDDAEQTIVKASLGATDHFEVRWYPAAGSTPMMDLLTSVANQTNVRVEAGLIQTTASLKYEVLRGELTEITVHAPSDASIIDVVSAAGRIRSWKAEPVGDTHQKIQIELLTPATDRFDVEIQTERTPDSDTFQLVGKSEDGKLHGIHAAGVVRESGRITLTADASLTTAVVSQSGVKRIEAASADKSGETDLRQAWEFSGQTGSLVVQTKPVEPRLLVAQNSQIVFDDDELKLTSRLTYTVERAGVFQLNLEYPKSLTIDTVRADGMSEFNVDKTAGKLTLALNEKRLGKINVDITAHQTFDATAEGAVTEVPSVTPLNVEREDGQLTLFAPQFLDVITVDEQLSGLFPNETPQARIGRAVRVSAWKYTQRPFSISVKTTPRPAQLAASVATTANIEPDVVKVSSLLQFEVRNAGIDTYRVSVPESVASDVRFRSLNSNHTIQQRDKATEAEDGWITWTLVLQDEVTGTVQLAAEWDIPLNGLDTEIEGVEQTLTLEPVRVLPPFTGAQADKRKVTLTQTRGEIRLLRHESLSITAEGAGDTMEKIDVRELELMPQDGYQAFRYFSQPASATVTIRKHEIHDVVATVVSRAAIEIVTDKQPLANYRCRLRITSSERQRLRIDLPLGADLQAPLLNSRRTTFEAATDVEVQDGWEAYYVNISRDGTSDEEFLLAFQFRCPISAGQIYPYEGRGSKQVLRIPLIGDDTGGTVHQETRVAVWCPKDVSFIGEPRNWTMTGRYVWNFWKPLVSPSAATEAQQLQDWIGDSSSGADFARQGNVTVYRSLGRKDQIKVVWWNRPFLVAVISGALLFVGFILRRTSWENRLSLIIFGCLAVALWSLKDNSETMQFLSAGSLGLVAVAGIWIVGLFLGQHTNRDDTRPAPTDTTPLKTPPPEPVPPAAPASVSPLLDAAASSKTSEGPPATVTPSPAVTKMIDDLMGGKW